MSSGSRIEQLIGPTVAGLGYDLVACEVVPQGTRLLLRIYIDSEEGVTLRDCEIVSRQIGAVLEVEDPHLGRYVLEVSSPGSDRLLVKEAHYQRFIGHDIKVTLRQSRNGRRNYRGVLQQVNDGQVTMVVDGDSFIFAISDIEKANLVPES